MKFQIVILLCLTIVLFIFTLDVKRKIYSQEFLIEEVLYRLSLVDLKKWSKFKIKIKGFTFVVENKESLIQITKEDFWGILKKTYTYKKETYAD